MKHYLVTGGAGFIGNHLVRKLLAMTGTRVTCIDNFDPFYSPLTKRKNIEDFVNNPHFILHETDLSLATAGELVDLLPDHIDAIIHIAAKAGVRPSILNPLDYQKTNVVGLQNLLEFARLQNIQQFVFASSSSVYGINDHFPWKEDEQLMPISPYAMTKLAGEMLGHVYSQLYNMRFIALRFFTVYGPAQRPDLAIHKFTRAIVAGDPITMYGNGDTSRDYTYVDDIVTGVIAATTYDKSNFEVINLGNSYTVTLKELIGEIEKVTGRKAILEHFPEQPGDVPRTFADISKAKELLNYQPSTRLSDGLQNFYHWLKTR